jgi:hypothetical protein
MRRVRRQVQAQAQGQLQYKKLGDSDLLISEVTLGTVRTKPSSHYCHMFFFRSFLIISFPR